MDPAAAFWLTVQDDPQQTEEAKGALKLHERDFVLCPINDSRDGSMADGGTHWTLLVCWDRSCGPGLFGRFSYYDSLGPSSSKGTGFAQAKLLASRLAGQ